MAGLLCFCYASPLHKFSKPSHRDAGYCGGGGFVFDASAVMMMMMMMMMVMVMVVKHMVGRLG